MNNLILYSFMERFFNYFSILHKMKKYISALRFITLLFLPLFSFANMAQTYFAGTDHSSLYLVSDKENDNGCFVKKENLYIKIDKNKEKSKFSTHFADFTAKLRIKSKTTKNNIISSYKGDYFFERKIREDRVLDILDRFFQK